MSNPLPCLPSSDFFKRSNLATDFEWDEEYWPKKGMRSPRQDFEEEDDIYEQSAHTDFGFNRNESYEDFQARMKAQYEEHEKSKQQKQQQQQQ